MVLKRLLEAEPAVTHKNIVYLLEVEINVVMVVRVLATMPFSFPLFFGCSACSSVDLVEPTVLRLVVCLDRGMTFLELVLILVSHVQVGEVLRLWIQVTSADCGIHLWIRCLAHGDFVILFLLVFFLVACLAFLGGQPAFIILQEGCSFPWSILVF